MAPALSVSLAFASGGYFPGATAVAAVVLGVALAVRIVASRPAVALPRPAALVAAVALGGYVVWILVSAAWSRAPGRAVIEFDRALLYLLCFVWYATLPACWARVLLRASAAALVVVVLAALASRLLPDVLAIEAPEDRLDYPFGYWNAVGLAAGLAALVCLHLAGDDRERLGVRAAWAAAVPAASVALYLTLSRGALAATVAGLVALLVSTRSRALLLAAVATMPWVALAVAIAYGSPALVGFMADDRAAVAQGHRGAAAVVGCAAAAAATLGLLARVARPVLDKAVAPRTRNTVRRLAIGAVLCLGLAGATVAVVTGTVDRLSTVPASDGDLRSRLGDVGSNGRLDLWRIGLEGFREAPLTGSGAGTFGKRWAAERSYQTASEDAHSLYVETLSELGVGGAALLLAGISTSLRAMWRRRSADHRTWSAAAVLCGTWLLHAAVDWDWELPALGVLVFAWLGSACGVTGGRSLSAPRPAARVVPALLVLALLVAPVRVGLSQLHLRSAQQAFERGDCVRTSDQARAATAALDLRPEPLVLRGYCAIRQGRPALAVQLLEAAERRDPDDWRWLYGLAVAQGTAGEDPRGTAARALRANPVEPIVKELVLRLDAAGPDGWTRVVEQAPLVLPLEARAASVVRTSRS